MTITEIFAANLKYLREALGYNINNVAMLAQVSWSRWAAWEAGTRTPRIAMLPRIARALNCTVSHLFSNVHPAE